MFARALVATSVLLVSSVAFGDAQALISKAESAMRELDYGDALKALEAARKEPGNPRALVLKSWELQGVALASMGQEAKALKAFQTWLSLEPDAKLAGNQPPKVTTVFFEARSWAAQKGGLAVKQSATVTGAGVRDVRVDVTNDPLKLVKELRFVLTVDGKPRQVDVPVAGGGAVAPVGAPRVEWWALVLGEKKSVLLEVGSAAKPFVEGAAPAVVAKVEPPTPEVKPAEKPVEPPPPPPPPLEEVREAAPVRTLSTLRLAGIVSGAAGVVALGVGSVFGVMASGTTARIASAERDASGRIIGLTRAEALVLDGQQRTQATLANLLWVSGAVLVGTGAVLFFLGADAPVALVPAEGGAGVAGRF